MKMAKNHYRLFFTQMGDGNGVIESEVVVTNRDDVVVSLRLPHEPSYELMNELRRKIGNEKPPVVIRNIVAAWAQQLSRRKG
jgi:hypothetical protein